MYKNLNIPLKILITLLAAALIGGILGSIITSNLLKASTDTPTVYNEASQTIDAIKKISPSVVNIIGTKNLPLYRQQVFTFDDLALNDPSFDIAQLFPGLSDVRVDQKSSKIGGGSGFIVSPDGLVITNLHVVDDPAAEYTIILNDDTEHPATVIITNELNDLAILQIQSNDGLPISGLQTANLGDSDQIQVGQQIIAIGSAITTGVISAKNRSITAGSGNTITTLTNLIQTDAAINTGNSGGPLVNLNGEVIGINTAFASNSESISFAIPINHIKDMLIERE